MQVEQIIIVIHVLAAIAITGLVLIQRGKGADIGASFGGGASQTMFGSLGSGNVLTRSTTILTVVFFATSLGLAVVASERADRTVQDSSLISGDIEQINSELRAAPQSDIPAPAPAPAAPAGDLPAEPLEAAPAAAGQEDAAEEAPAEAAQEQN